MDFRPDDEQRALVDAARTFVTRELEPLFAPYSPDEPYPKEVMLEAFSRMQPFGYLGGTIPEELGGLGMSLTTYGMLLEALPHPIFISTFITGTVSGNIARASGPVREKYLPDLLTGRRIGAAAITEPNVGSYPAAAETTAVQDGDSWIINGTKMFISNGAIADVVTVTASLDRSLGAKGLATFIVDKDESPFEARYIPTIGERNDFLGELTFRDCRIPLDNLIVPEGNAYAATLKGFQTARGYVALTAVHVAQLAIDAAVQYAKDRPQFGKPIASFQMIQDMLAEMQTECDAARLLAYRALDATDRGERVPHWASMAKWYATEMAVRVTGKAVQIHGAYGLTEEFPVSRYYRDARMLTIPDGTTQIQKLIIGREMTGIDAIR